MNTTADIKEITYDDCTWSVTIPKEKINEIKVFDIYAIYNEWKKENPKVKHEIKKVNELHKSEKKIHSAKSLDENILLGGSQTMKFVVSKLENSVVNKEFYHKTSDFDYNDPFIDDTQNVVIKEAVFYRKYLRILKFKTLKST